MLHTGPHSDTSIVAQLIAIICCRSCFWRWPMALTSYRPSGSLRHGRRAAGCLKPTSSPRCVQESRHCWRFMSSCRRQMTISAVRQWILPDIVIGGRSMTDRALWPLQSRFVEVAGRARAAKEQGRPLKPLAQPKALMLSVHSSAAARPGGGTQKQKQKGASKAVLEKLAAMLGAKVGSSLCIGI